MAQQIVDDEAARKELAGEAIMEINELLEELSQRVELLSGMDEWRHGVVVRALLRRAVEVASAANDALGDPDTSTTDIARVVRISKAEASHG